MPLNSPPSRQGPSTVLAPLVLSSVYRKAAEFAVGASRP
jgi:hypothetical protein